MSSKLEERIIDVFNQRNSKHSYSLWEMADILYDNCMQKSQPGNGGRIAAIRKAAEKSENLIYFVNHNENQCISLKSN